MLNQEIRLMDSYTPRLKEIYNNTLVEKLKEELSISNRMALPKLIKVSLIWDLAKPLMIQK